MPGSAVAAAMSASLRIAWYWAVSMPSVRKNSFSRSRCWARWIGLTPGRTGLWRWHSATVASGTFSNS